MLPRPSEKGHPLPTLDQGIRYQPRKGRSSSKSGRMNRARQPTGASELVSPIAIGRMTAVPPIPDRHSQPASDPQHLSTASTGDSPHQLRALAVQYTDAIRPAAHRRRSERAQYRTGDQRSDRPRRLHPGSEFHTQKCAAQPWR